MARLLNMLKAALLAVWLTISIGIGWWFWHIHVTLETTLRDTHTTVLEIGLTASNLRKASAAWEQASKDQATVTTDTMLRLNVTVDEFSSLLSNTNRELNTSLFPLIREAVSQQNSSLLESQNRLRQNLAEMSAATQQLQKTLVDADAQIANPAVTQAIDNLATASENTAKATEHLSNVAADGEKVADYYQKRLTTPQGFLKTLVQALLQLGSQARILLSK